MFLLFWIRAHFVLLKYRRNVLKQVRIFLLPSHPSYLLCEGWEKKKGRVKSCVGMKSCRSFFLGCFIEMSEQNYRLNFVIVMRERTRKYFRIRLYGKILGIFLTMANVYYRCVVYYKVMVRISFHSLWSRKSFVPPFYCFIIGKFSGEFDARKSIVEK